MTRRLTAVPGHLPTDIWRYRQVGHDFWRMGRVSGLRGRRVDAVPRRIVNTRLTGMEVADVKVSAATSTP
jgi:hypothetical protein